MIRIFLEYKLNNSLNCTAESFDSLQEALEYISNLENESQILKITIYQG